MLVVVACLTWAGAAGAEVIGKATGPLEATKAREAECSFGDLVADAARSAVGAEVALVQASQLRDGTLPAGDLRREDLAGLLLYPDEKVVLVELGGAQLQAALERGLSMVGKRNTAFLQVSGMTVTFRSDAPKDHRVLGVQVGGAPLASGRTYKVAMPSSLANGALGYFRVFNPIKVTKVGPAIGDAVADYVAAARTVSPQSGRLRDLAPRGGPVTA
jgi:2',3'-cyclic-nucleotide 2'-phosphodiesterase (5'-nucleotidase family)